MSVTPISGKSGRVMVNNVTWNFSDCSVKFMVNLGDDTGFEDQQADGTTTTNRGTGLQDFQGTITGPVNAAQMPSPTFNIGVVLTTLQIFLDKAIAPRYCGCSYVIVEQVEYHPKVQDAVQMVTITVKAGGAVGAGQSVVIVQPT